MKLDRWVMRTPAWQSLSHGARALYLEIKLHFNGRNNGQILFSQRMGEDIMRCARNTVSRWLKELIAKGFLEVSVGHSLGPAGVGKSTLWTLTEEPTPDGRKATYAFKNWKPSDAEK